MDEKNRTKEDGAMEEKGFFFLSFFSIGILEMRKREMGDERFEKG